MAATLLATTGGWSDYFAVVISLLSLVVSVCAYLSTVRTGKIQNTLELFRWLESDEVRQARSIVYKVGETDGSLTDDPKIEDRASLVCASFNFAGAMKRRRLIRNDFLFDMSPVISRCYTICEPLIDKRREVHQEFWKDFELLNQAIKNPGDEWRDRRSYLLKMLTRIGKKTA